MKHAHYRQWFLILALTLTGAAHAGCGDPAALPSPDCGRTPTPAFDGDGRLWAAFVQHGHVYVTSSKDAGSNFTSPVAVNARAEPVYTNGENRPKIAFGPEDEVYVSWTKKTEGRFTGDIRFSRSLDGGETFETPRTVNDDGLPTSHRFDALHVSPSGLIYLAWLDKRDKVTAEADGGDYTGAAVYYAVSDNRGATFSKNRKIADHSCECCRIGAAPAADNGVTLFWRHIFDANTRDHALATLTPQAKDIAVRRATVDDWRVDACPHHGPSIAAGKAGHHLTWFTNGSRRQGIYYGRLEPETGEVVDIAEVDPAAGAAHPYVWAAAGTVHLVWKRFEDGRSRLLHRRSADRGAHWSEPAEVARTAGASDHPLLAASSHRVYASWWTEKEGYRLIELGEAP